MKVKEFNCIFIGGLLFLLCIHESWSMHLNYPKVTLAMDRRIDASVSDISPSSAPRPFLPMQSPLPLAPFTNNTVPKLSGLCTLNFTAAESLMRMTSIDCYAIMAPLLANLICCPQLEATVVILIGQYSKNRNVLALNERHAKYCFSDIEQILAGQGGSKSLRHICQVYPSHLAEASCPVKDVDEFERTVDSSKLLAACEKIDPVKECCEQVCQNAILDAATGISQKPSGLLSLDSQKNLSENSTKINDCRMVVLRWLASKLDASSAKKVLRGLSNCAVNKVCPLDLADTRHVAKDCANDIANHTACCIAMASYVSHLQKQTLITNLQALDCAAKLGMKLQKSNITKDVYNLCHVSLKDFSVQVGSQESGCLLPSLPSDAILDKSSGVSFLCDLNDNIPAPWPSVYQLPDSPCNKTVNIPALPTGTSGQSGFYSRQINYLFYVSLWVIMTTL